MDIGRIVKTIFVPLPDEVKQPERVDPKEEPIPVENWPIKLPVKEPAKQE